MPKWARLNSTRDASLGERMGSVFENGYGDEGPMAKGCCMILFVLVVAPIYLIPASLLVWLVYWLAH